MSDWHIFTHPPHCTHFITMNCVDKATSTEEECCLEHSMGEEMEHTCHITDTKFMVDQFRTCSTRQRHANSQSHHHESYLRDSRESQDTFNVTLCASNCRSIESCKCSNPSHNMKSVGSIGNPKREHTCHLVNTSNDHGCSMNQCTNRRWALHCIGKPNVKGEHSTFTCTTNEHEEQSSRQHKGCTCKFTHATCFNKTETKGLCIVTINKNTNEEE